MPDVVDLRSTLAPMAAAREFVRSRLGGGRTVPQIEEAVWAASELVSTAVTHHVTDMALVIDLTGEGVRLELRDSHDRPVMVEDEPLVAEIT